MCGCNRMSLVNTFMNLSKLSENLGIEEKEYVDLIGLFIETSDAEIKDLVGAIDRADAARAAGHAHSLKGASLNLGLNDFFKIAQKIESAIEDNRLEASVRTIALLKEQLDIVAAATAARCVSE